MGKISSDFSFMKNFILNKDVNKNVEFTISNNILLLTRIKIASIILLVLYIYFFYADFLLYKGMPENHFRFFLTGIHLIGSITSIAFLFIHKLFKNESIYHTVWPTITINFYIFSYLMGGALASINSQQLNGNIYADIVILMGVAALFPVRPKHFFFILLFTQIIFLFGIYHFSESSKYDLVSKQINSIGTATIAFIICLAFYSYRKRDFQNQLRIENSEQNLLHLFNVNPYPLVLSNLENGKILLANDKALEFYGVEEEELDSLDINLFYTRKEERSSIIEQLKTDGDINNCIVEQKITDGSKKWVLVNYKLIEYMNEKCVLTGATDITDLKKIEAELEMYATTDMLTGVLNRRRGMEILQDTLTSAKMDNSKFVLLFIDINNLKKINDQYGHPEGDYLVKTVCDVISSKLDNQDIIFRFGGDEFIITFVDKDKDHADKIWIDIINALHEVDANNHKPFDISISHGLFYYDSEHHISMEEIIDYADKEMYREKNRMKKNRSLQSI